MSLKDIVYIYDKETYAQSELGEIQKDFNISPTIDGTKDSFKMSVFNFSGIEVEPQSIIQHRATKTWWVVKHDKVTRYMHENGFLYEHELQLNGAIELLNARDLTDSGFNQNRYTIGSFFNRLIKHSNFDFKNNFSIVTNNNIVLTKKVDYLKTFENYSPLSALREFLDGYNCSIKLTFNTATSSSGTFIQSANFIITSKTGDMNGTIYQSDDFRDSKEVKTIDKDSYGTRVISNADNVVSVKAKTYPSTGCVKITGTGYTIKAGTDSNALIRLPSNAFKVNWVEMTRLKLPVTLSYGIGATLTTEYSGTYNPFNNKEIDALYDYLKIKFESAGDTNFETRFPKDRLKTYGKIKFYYTDKYDPISDTFSSEYPIPMRYLQSDITWNTLRQTVLSNSELKNNVNNVDDVICYERGKDYIDGITFFGDTGSGLNKAYFKKTNEGSVHSYGLLDLFIGTVETVGSGGERRFQVMERQQYNLADVGFVVNYIPMSDLKIKVDNIGTRKDSQLYNQTGKLTDSVAFSKQLLSYAKEIESDNITKYGDYYFTYHSNGTIEDNIPKVGSLVNINNEYYVINNISMDFFQNESTDDNSITYYVACEFTMSKNVAVKSLMVNPASNIRDYGIPQNNNVKRKQVYKDFYELNLYPTQFYSGVYLTLEKVLNLSNSKKDYQEHIAVMKITYNEPQNNSTNWYYQLESTTFVLKKSIYEIVDFKDNNIIGYGSQNVWSGFDITRILTGNYDLSNTPISYVDNNGEFESIDLLFVTNEKLTSAYDSYLTGKDLSNTSYGAFYSCFIPSEIFENEEYSLIYGQYDFRLNEQGYKKDALEVPVFEYCCQIDDSEQVVVGENIFSSNATDMYYMYGFVLCDKNKLYNDNNYELLTIPQLTGSSGAYSLTNAVVFQYSTQLIDGINRQIVIARFYDSVTYDTNTETLTTGNPLKISQLGDFTQKDLFFVKHIITNIPKDSVTTSEIVSGSANDGEITYTLPLTASQRLVSATLVLKDGYYNDSVYKSSSKSGNTIYYVIGGTNYDTTEAQGTLTINKQVASSSGTIGVSGSANDGSQTTRVTLESGQTLTNATIQLDAEYKSDTPYYTSSYSGRVVTYKIGGQTYNDTIASGELYATIEYETESSTNYVRSVSGNRNHGNYTYNVSLSSGETLSNVWIREDDDTILGVFAEIVSVDYSNGVITYRCGASQGSLTIDATLYYTKTSTTTISTEASIDVSGTKDQNQLWTVSPWASGYRITSTGFRNVVLNNNFYSNPYANVSYLSNGIITYSIGCDNGLLELSATITYTKSAYNTTETVSISGNRTQQQSYTFSLGTGESYVSYEISNVVLLNNNVIGSFASLVSFTDQGVIKYRLGQTIQNADVEATLTYTYSDSNNQIDKDMLFLVRDIDTIENDSYTLTLYANNYKID